MMIQKLRFTVFFLVLSASISAQSFRIDPPNWWTNMVYNEVELLISGENAGLAMAELDVTGIKILKQEKLDSPDHLLLEISISADVRASDFNIVLKWKKKKKKLPFRILERNRKQIDKEGINTSDFIYLIMPDRFANGDPTNDIVPGMQEADVHRDSMFDRHGGDLQGILNHLDYVEDLGVTALWLNPVLENDQPWQSYHGYAITDHYKIDSRFGDNALYRKLADECHGRGMKIIKDMVYNHWGDQHYLHKNLPQRDWIHWHDAFLKTSYRAPTLMDPYASQKDRDQMTDGWFDKHMPDLNQKNPHLARYLIQNSLWWIEFAGLDGFRIDTYAYSDQDFMQDLLKAVLNDYPNFGVFGETWVHGIPVQAFFAENKIDNGAPSVLPGVTDFQLYYALNDALNKPMGWTDGVSRIYYTLAKDYVYKDAFRNVLFLDNHDLSRFYSVIGEDIRKFKMGIAFLMTMRGIPMLYYGTEILMKNYADPDGKVREDFPGGWADDTKNMFSASGRDGKSNEVYDYIKNLAAWRKTNSAVQDGKLVQFVPENGVYVYFRFNDEKNVMVIMNCNDKARDLELSRFAERIGANTEAKDVILGRSCALDKVLELQPWSVRVLEF